MKTLSQIHVESLLVIHWRHSPRNANVQHLFVSVSILDAFCFDADRQCICWCNGEPGPSLLTYLHRKRARCSPEHTDGGLQMQSALEPRILKHLYCCFFRSLSCIRQQYRVTEISLTIVAAYGACKPFFELFTRVVLFILEAESA